MSDLQTLARSMRAAEDAFMAEIAVAGAALGVPAAKHFFTLASIT
jgi:hypothetical protein